MRKKILLWMSAMIIAGLMIADVGIILAESGGGGTDPSCDAGGPGAVACSLSVSGGVGVLNGGFECQVTCGQGYYACCSVAAAGCNCKAYNATSGGGGTQD